MECDFSAYACLEPVYSDGIAGVLNLGVNMMVCFFRWQMGPGGIFERTPALCMVRPRASVVSGEAFAKMLASQKSPAEAIVITH